VDDRGQCRCCRPRLSKRRRWLPWQSRTGPCRVLAVASFFAISRVEDIWPVLRPRLGIRRELGEPETNPLSAATCDTIPISSQTPSTGRHARTRTHT
jgi:hypothetical protein